MSSIWSHFYIFIRCIVLLINADSIEYFQRILTDTLTVASGRHNGSLIHSPYKSCPTEKSFIELKNKIKGNYYSTFQIECICFFRLFNLFQSTYIFTPKNCMVLELNITCNTFI